MNHVDVMKQALDAHEHALGFTGSREIDAMLRASSSSLREAIAQAEKVDPVAWRYIDANGSYRYRGYVPNFDRDYPLLKPKALYAAPAAQQEPDSLHLAAMDLVRKQADRTAELEAEVERFRADAMNERAARQALERQLAALVPLTDGHKREMWKSATIDQCSHENCYLRGISDSEAAHGITKGST